MYNHTKAYIEIITLLTLLLQLGKQKHQSIWYVKRKCGEEYCSWFNRWMKHPTFTSIIWPSMWTLSSMVQPFFSTYRYKPSHPPILLLQRWNETSGLEIDQQTLGVKWQESNCFILAAKKCHHQLSFSLLNFHTV